MTIWQLIRNIKFRNINVIYLTFIFQKHLRTILLIYTRLFLHSSVLNVKIVNAVQTKPTIVTDLAMKSIIVISELFINKFNMKKHIKVIRL